MNNSACREHALAPKTLACSRTGHSVLCMLRHTHTFPDRTFQSKHKGNGRCRRRCTRHWVKGGKGVKSALPVEATSTDLYEEYKRWFSTTYLICSLIAASHAGWKLTLANDSDAVVLCTRSSSAETADPADRPRTTPVTSACGSAQTRTRSPRIGLPIGPTSLLRPAVLEVTDTEGDIAWIISTRIGGSPHSLGKSASPHL